MAWTYVGGTTSAQLDHTTASAAVALPGGTQAGDVLVISTHNNIENAGDLAGILFDENMGVAIDQGFPTDYGANTTVTSLSFMVAVVLEGGDSDPTFSADAMLAGDYGFVRLDVFRSDTAAASPVAISARRNHLSSSIGTAGVGFIVFTGFDLLWNAGSGDTVTLDMPLFDDIDLTLGGITIDRMIVASSLFSSGNASSISTGSDGERTWVETVETKSTDGGGLHGSVCYSLNDVDDTHPSYTATRVGGSGTPENTGAALVLGFVSIPETGPEGAMTKTPTFVGASTPQVITDSAAPVALNLPANLQDGDVLIFLASLNIDATGPSIDLGASQGAGGSSHVVANYSLTSSENVPCKRTVAWDVYMTNWQGWEAQPNSFGANDTAIVCVLAFRGVDLSAWKPGIVTGSGESALATGAATDGTAAQNMTCLPMVPYDEFSAGSLGVYYYADKFMQLIVGPKADDWTSVAIGAANSEYSWQEAIDTSNTTDNDEGLSAYYAVLDEDVIGDNVAETMTVTGGAAANSRSAQLYMAAEPLGTRKYPTITYVGAGAVAGPANTGTLTPDLPAGIQDGDTLILIAGGSIVGGVLYGSHVSGDDWDASLIGDENGGATQGYQIHRYQEGTTVAPTVTPPAGAAATDNWWSQILAFRGTQDVGLSGLFGGGTSDNITYAFSAAPTDIFIGAGVSFQSKQANNSSVAGPGANDGVTWVDVSNSHTATNDDASLVISYFLNNDPAVQDLDADATWTYSGSASADHVKGMVFIMLDVEKLFYENAESGSTIGVSVIEHDMLAEADVDGSTAVTSVVAGALQSETVITSTIPADSTISAAIMYFHQFVLTGLITCESAISSLVSFPIRIFTGAINATSAVTSSIIARVLNTFRIKSEWGTTGGGGRRRLNKDLAKVLTRPRRNQT